MKKLLLFAMLITATALGAGRFTNSDLSGSAGITNANLATMPTMTVKGNNTGGAATPLDLTASQLKTLLSISAGDLSNGTTGSGLVVLQTSPTLVTPTIGAALATSINGMSLSCGGGSCSFSIAPSKSVAVNNSLAFSGTDGASLNIGAGGTLAASAFTDTTDASNITSGILNIARIAANAITNSKLAQMAAATIKGRASGAGTGDPTDLTGTQVTAILDTFTASLKGLVPPPGGSPTGSNCLKDDGTWGTCGTGGGGGLDVARFVLEGAVVPFTSINGPKYQAGTQTLSSVNISALNSGTSGSTTIQVNQYRAGALQASATASLASSSGNPNGGAAALSSSLSLIAGDILTVDVVSAAAGASDLTVEWGTVAAPTGGTTLTVLTKTANYTVTNSDDVLTFNCASACTATLHASASATAKPYRIYNGSATALSLALSGGNTFPDGSTTGTMAPGSTATFIPDGGSSWLVFGQ